MEEKTQKNTNEQPKSQSEKAPLSNRPQWQRRRFFVTIFLTFIIFGGFLTYTVTTLYNDKCVEDTYWNSALTSDSEVQDYVDKHANNALKVTVGTYIENLKEINIKSNYFRVVMMVWFKWDANNKTLSDMSNNFRVYKGTINSKTLMDDKVRNGQHYQQLELDVTVTKNYWTKRFPLESHQLRVYIESLYRADMVDFVNDKDSSLNTSLNISGYRINRYASGVYYNEYTNDFGDPSNYTDGKIVTPEQVTAIQINRDSWGLYIKCFIALIGTITWVLMMLYININHRIDPLGMIPGALFGTVSNIMVGANLLPDALQTGLVEFVNIYGVMIILVSAIIIINVNWIRNRREDRVFAHQYGQVMFWVILAFTLIGMIIMPVSAYMW